MPNQLSLVRRVKEPTELSALKMQDDTLVQITGHLGQNPQMRLAGAKQVASVGVAVSWGKKPEQTTVWFNVEAWEQQADILQEFSKGEAVTVTGPRKSREYNGKTYWGITAWDIARPVWRVGELPPKAQGQQAGNNDVDLPESEIPF